MVGLLAVDEDAVAARLHAVQHGVHQSQLATGLHQLVAEVGGILHGRPLLALHQERVVAALAQLHHHRLQPPRLLAYKAHALMCGHRQ